MDRIWDNIGCDNLNLNYDRINQFYSHPIWLFNGMWLETHKLSMQHRHAISDYIITQGFQNVIDYGGGFGTLARLIANKEPSICIDIFEPHPTEYVIKLTKNYTNIHFIDEINDKYDCLVSTDVLEHVEDPLNIFEKMINTVQLKGYLIMANNFYPIIKCHLPSNFHFICTFNIFTKMMGLNRIGYCKKSHATIYQKNKDIAFDWEKIRKYEKISQMTSPFLNIAFDFYIKLKSIIK